MFNSHTQVHFILVSVMGMPVRVRAAVQLPWRGVSPGQSVYSHWKYAWCSKCVLSHIHSPRHLKKIFFALKFYFNSYNEI